MIELTLDDIARATSGRLVPGRDGSTASTVVEGESQTDSREVRPGQIFFARRGEETDGHRFAGQAVDSGAALLVVEREVDDRVAQIVVEDATDALGALATEVVRRALAAAADAHAADPDRPELTIVGITGSNGKTTTKNLVQAMAERLGPTVASAKSFNNEVGGPLTMLRVSAETRTLVAEMGASAEGEIARLTAMAPPRIGVVLSVGLAHAGEFGGIESTFRAKSEMVRDLPGTAVAVLNRDDPRVARMAELTRARVVWFGLGSDADVRAENVVSDAAGTRFTLHAGGEAAPVNFRVLGEHHVMNALAAAAVGLELGLPLAEVVASLEAATVAARWRMEVMGGRDGVTIVNDAYNASPDSMSAALRTLAQITAPGARSIAVLGEMSELGEFSIEEHRRIGLQAVRLGITELVVVGPEARHLHISAVNEGSWDGESVFFEDQDAAFEHLRRTLEPGDTVLVKSSNAAGLRRLGDRLGETYAVDAEGAES
ncbi:UDP-N-acetylmuramoyl-tripeptide--D-alanyl-D-alanine ligase [Leucobacter sp. CSA1]|uniref:UDP-N-acetylmuramoyl-tripeptide--D-alanyl-D-alanine ligase n=1 Tax=Leucobacter chromiisoli TaxID=2796471 RepID=A0A934Q9W2_9MICO|nr:UDP-N-acetylmuramoyl-tripeptide--D-alanyl-D-alanine ligase [Leucobacter chromiisoli]MBK0419212.1 UDP-N-acetylmuramoyl-tripeptide--D-alanyl-D-alanine ligase [Leucobacter chromiisoli]